MRNKETIGRVLKFIRPYRGRILLMLVLAVVTVVCTHPVYACFDRRGSGYADRTGGSLV